MDKVFPKVQKLWPVQKLTPNERCFTCYIFSFFCQVQVVLVKHFADASHLEKEWAQVPELKSTGEGSGTTRSGRFGYSFQSRRQASRAEPGTASKDSCCWSLPPHHCQLSFLSPAGHQRGASAGGTPGQQSRHTGSGHGSSTVCVRLASAEGPHKTELRQTTQTTSGQWRKVTPEGKKGNTTQLHFSPCSSKPEGLPLTCLLDGPCNELGTVLSMEIVYERIKQQNDIREYANNYIVQTSIRQHSILFRAMLTLVG